MWYFISTILPLGFNVLTILVGLVAFRYLNVAYKIILINLLIGLGVELLGNHINGNNSSVFNLFLPIDGGLSMLAGFILINQKRYLPLFIMSLIFMWGIWIYCIYLGGINNFSSISFTVNAVLIITEYLIVLYRYSLSSTMPWLQIPSFWLCLGTIFFYSCNIPIFSMLNIINSNLSLTELHYLVSVIIVMSVLSYLQISYSFFLFYHQK
jgi:hypothetical protein